MSAVGGLLGGSPVYFGYTGLIDVNGGNRIGAALAGARNNAAIEVHLLMNSPGGTAADGIYLYNLMRSMRLPSRTHNLGSAFSAALLPFLGADRRTCSPNSTFMTHPAHFTLAQASGVQLKNSLASALLEDERIEAVLRERTRLPRKLLNARRRQEVHFSADDALKYGIVDEIVEFAIPEGAKYIQV